jgi:NACHT domain
MGLIASEQGLKTIDRKRMHKGWNRQGQGWADKALVSVGTLKRFWSRKPINQTFFKSICDALGVDWEEIAERQETQKIFLQEDCNQMPDVNIFYGRNEELSNLEESVLQNQCRVVVLSGFQGIGKTTLAAKLTEKVKADFDYFSWQSLNYSPPPTLSELLFSVINFLSNKESINPYSTESPNNIDALISELLKIFVEHRVLLVIDGWENVLRREDRRVNSTDYDKYGQFLKLIAEIKHKSCVVITTEEEPKELSSLTVTQPVNLLKLSGLDFEAGLEILKLKEIIFTPQQAKELINKDYCGNPLALLHICGHIQRVFAGKLSLYQAAHTILYPLEIETAIEEHCKSLTDLETEIVKILANESIPIDYEKLKLQIRDNNVSNSVLQTALSSLFIRSLIEINSRCTEVLYSLQPFIRKCVRKFYSIG